MNTKKLLKIAKTINASKEIKTRDTGDKFICYNDSIYKDQWQKICMNCHNDLAPNDWIYSKIDDALACIIEYLESKTDEDFQEYADSFIDNSIDIYTADLLSWLASNINFASEVEETVKEYEINSNEFNLCSLLQQTQGRLIQNIFQTVFDSLKELADS